jgi:hypothetical protein
MQSPLVQAIAQTIVTVFKLIRQPIDVWTVGTDADNFALWTTSFLKHICHNQEKKKVKRIRNHTLIIRPVNSIGTYQDCPYILEVSLFSGCKCSLKTDVWCPCFAGDPTSGCFTVHFAKHMRERRHKIALEFCMQKKQQPKRNAKSSNVSLSQNKLC